MRKHLFLFRNGYGMLTDHIMQKNKNGTTTVDVNALILGKWTLTSMAYDSVGNGKLLASEIVPYSGGTKTETYNSNGKMFDTGYYGSGSGIYEQFQWGFIGNNTYIQVKSLDTGSSYGSTWSYRVDSINSKKVQFFDTGGREWYIYTK